MGKFQDLTGQKFGSLTVIKKIDNINGRTAYLCECECGNRKNIAGKYLKNGSTKTCGCGKSINPHHKKHGQSNNKIYFKYKNMINRCYRQEDKKYKNYGGRGIKVCDEWANNFEAFYFWAINNGYSNELTLDRINVNGDYKPSNCRWVDLLTQANNKTNNRIIKFNNELHTLAEWAKIKNIKYGTLSARLKRNWSIKKALTMPVFEYKISKSGLKI